ncbi:transposase [Methanobrevibacter arboriphilus]|uniref:transposase n=1 Tax=Methanobrevibacter arboriphilus TaxID=39441 RepID=UPI001301F13A|nr:transposase [Methanobrevibacter arboriphilus]
MSFDRVALFLLNKNGLTQTLEAYNFSLGLNIDNFSRQAFCQARMKFNPEIFKTISGGIYDCLNNMMIDFQIAPYKTSEKELAYKNIEKALKLFKNDEIILIFDRGYPSIEFFQFLTEKNIKFIFRIKKDNYKFQTNKIEGNKGIINLKTKKNHQIRIN